MSVKPKDIITVANYLGHSNFKLVNHETKEETVLSKQLKKKVEKIRSKKQPSQKKFIKSLLKNAKGLSVKTSRTPK